MPIRRARDVVRADRHGVGVLGAPEVLSDELRPDAAAVLGTFRRDGVAIKVISGDDLLALKRGDLGVAMGSGSPATCAVAQLVLLNYEFAALPRALGEGRRVIGNVDRVARMFLTTSVYSLLLALAVGVAMLPFPFLPRQLSLIGALTIGIPGVFLSMAPNSSRARPGMVGDVLRFAVPAGSVAAAATFAGYYVTRLLPDVDIDEARTTATLVLLSVGLLVLARLARPLTTARRMLIGAMTGAMVLVTLVPGLRAASTLDPPPPIVVLAAIGIVAIGVRVLHFADSVGGVRRRSSADGAGPPGPDMHLPVPERAAAR